MCLAMSRLHIAEEVQARALAFHHHHGRDEARELSAYERPVLV